jgi:hypothetical protein
MNRDITFQPIKVKHYPMKTYRGLEVYLHSFFTSALDGDLYKKSLYDENISLLSTCC